MITNKFESQAKGLRLSTTEFAFLTDMRIPIDELLDCQGRSVKALRAFMRETGKTIGFNTTPCHEHGHTIRTRAGHCLMCSPRNYGFLKQYIGAGYVYVAYSLEADIVKVGITRDPDRREYFLRYFAYADARDWQVQLSHYIEARAGDVETALHQALSGYYSAREYSPNGTTVRCREIFQFPDRATRRVTIMREWGSKVIVAGRPTEVH